MNFPPAFHIHSANKRDHFPIQHNVKSYALAHRTQEALHTSSLSMYVGGLLLLRLLLLFVLKIPVNRSTDFDEKETTNWEILINSIAYRLELKFSEFNLSEHRLHFGLFKIMKTHLHVRCGNEKCLFLCKCGQQNNIKRYNNSCLFCLTKKMLAKFSIEL